VFANTYVHTIIVQFLSVKDVIMIGGIGRRFPRASGSPCKIELAVET